MTHAHRAGLAAIGAAIVLVGTGVVVWRVLALRQTAHEAREHLVAARDALSEPIIAVAPQTSDPSDQSALPLSRSQLVSACTEAAKRCTLSDFDAEGSRLAIFF